MMRSLIIWLPGGDGKTMKFENVKYFKETDQKISFEYDGVSTGESRSANFYIKDMLGYALSIKKK
jgi:hypothetical protein